MLVSSKNSAEEHHRQILESTRCIAFMGTPHCGSQLADWAKVGTSMTKIVKRLNENIISVLQPDSEVLARIQQEFHTMLRARNDESKPKIKIVCFYEDLDTTGIGAVRSLSCSVKLCRLPRQRLTVTGRTQAFCNLTCLQRHIHTRKSLWND